MQGRPRYLPTGRQANGAHANKERGLQGKYEKNYKTRFDVNGISFDSSNNAVWVANNTSNTVTKISAGTYPISGTSIQTGPGLPFIAR